MTDRTKEVVEEFADIVFNFKKPEEAIEGDWYMFEKEGRSVRAHRVVKRTLSFIASEISIDEMIEWGWTATPVTIFRKNET